MNRPSLYFYWPGRRSGWKISMPASRFLRLSPTLYSCVSAGGRASLGLGPAGWGFVRLAGAGQGVAMAVALDAVWVRVKGVCKQNGLLILSVLAVVIGCLLGFFLRTKQLSEQVSGAVK
ncbi:hypothetical protein AOLI_G00154040 [Acnodon oligacanthus]